MKRILNEPLLHFLLLGGAIFAGTALRGRTVGDALPQRTEGGVSVIAKEAGDQAKRRIEVTGAVIDRLGAGYQQQFGQQPDAQELRGLVEQHLKEEVLYREALALGLDQDDTIVRRRMAQKMEFLTGDLSDAAASDEASVRVFFERNAARYARPAQVSFRHVYFSKDKRGASVEATARQSLADLSQGASDDAMGDPFLHGFVFASQDAREITALFGEDFAVRLAAMPEGEWSGPIASSYGMHLVRIDARGPVQPASFDAVRDAVVRDFNEEHRNTANRKILEKLRGRYEIVVDEAAIVKAAAPAKELVQQ